MVLQDYGTQRGGCPTQHVGRDRKDQAVDVNDAAPSLLMRRAYRPQYTTDERARNLEKLRSARRSGDEVIRSLATLNFCIAREAPKEGHGSSGRDQSSDPPGEQMDLFEQKVRARSIGAIEIYDNDVNGARPG
jgi:hypothetical protein